MVLPVTSQNLDPALQVADLTGQVEAQSGLWTGHTEESNESYGLGMHAPSNGSITLGY